LRNNHQKILSAAEIQKESGLSERCGNSGYPTVGNNIVAILQGTDELISPATEKIL
jgi:hypothetical protein